MTDRFAASELAHHSVIDDFFQLLVASRLDPRHLAAELLEKGIISNEDCRKLQHSELLEDSWTLFLGRVLRSKEGSVFQRFLAFWDEKNLPYSSEMRQSYQKLAEQHAKKVTVTRELGTECDLLTEQRDYCRLVKEYEQEMKPIFFDFESLYKDFPVLAAILPLKRSIRFRLDRTRINDADQAKLMAVVVAYIGKLDYIEERWCRDRVVCVVNSDRKENELIVCWWEFEAELAPPLIKFIEERGNTDTLLRGKIDGIIVRILQLWYAVGSHVRHLPEDWHDAILNNLPTKYRQLLDWGPATPSETLNTLLNTHLHSDLARDLKLYHHMYLFLRLPHHRLVREYFSKFIDSGFDPTTIARELWDDGVITEGDFELLMAGEKRQDRLMRFFGQVLRNRDRATFETFLSILEREEYAYWRELYSQYAFDTDSQGADLHFEEELCVRVSENFYRRIAMVHCVNQKLPTGSEHLGPLPVIKWVNTFRMDTVEVRSLLDAAQEIKNAWIHEQVMHFVEFRALACSADKLQRLHWVCDIIFPSPSGVPLNSGEWRHEDSIVQFYSGSLLQYMLNCSGVVAKVGDLSTESTEYEGAKMSPFLQPAISMSRVFPLLLQEMFTSHDDSPNPTNSPVTILSKLGLQCEGSPFIHPSYQTAWTKLMTEPDVLFSWLALFQRKGPLTPFVTEAASLNQFNAFKEAAFARRPARDSSLISRSQESTSIQIVQNVAEFMLSSPATKEFLANFAKAQSTPFFQSDWRQKLDRRPFTLELLENLSKNSQFVPWMESLGKLLSAVMPGTPSLGIIDGLLEFAKDPKLLSKLMLLRKEYGRDEAANIAARDPEMQQKIMSTAFFKDLMDITEQNSPEEQELELD